MQRRLIYSVLVFGVFLTACPAQNPQTAPQPPEPGPGHAKPAVQNASLIQKDLRDIFHECKKYWGCYQPAFKDYIFKDLCPDFKKHAFSSSSSCEKQTIDAAHNIFDDGKGLYKRTSYRIRRRRRRTRAVTYTPDPPADTAAPTAEAAPQPPQTQNPPTPPPNPPTPPPQQPATPPPAQQPAVIAGFCSRTAEVRTAILSHLSGVTCSTITQANLDSIVTKLVLRLSPQASAGGQCSSGDENAAALKAGDLQGLRRLRRVEFANSCLDALPSGIFSGLTDLRAIKFEITRGLGNVHPNSGFPDNVFSGLSNLQSIEMPECSAAPNTIPAFQSLPNSVTVENPC